MGKTSEEVSICSLVRNKGAAIFLEIPPETTYRKIRDYRNIIFSCVDQDNPRLEELLEAAADEGHSANVASFEYGINEAIPHSKGGELLCPNNVIGEGFALLTVLFQFDNIDSGPFFAGYVGLNNGNGRGSMDSFWAPNIVFDGDGN